MRVKFEETFKDGNIFGSRVMKVGEIVDIPIEKLAQARRSGAVITVQQEVKEEVRQEVKAEVKEEVKEEKAKPNAKKG